jgi:hypothetical protein
MRRIITHVLAGGVDAFGVVCYAKDEEAVTRERERYDEDVVLALRLQEEDEGIAAYVIGEVPADSVIAGRVWNVAPVSNALDDLAQEPEGVAEPERLRRHA